MIFEFSPSQSGYASLFSTIPQSPKKIFAEGNLELLTRLPQSGFAVVGTRAPQKRCLELTEKIILSLKGSGLVIISGLARGIDQKAHESALLAGLPTIAILGSGIDQTYPPENKNLRKRIIQSGGLILSEWGKKTDIYPAFFIQRNRLIAGLSQAVWVVQAGERSGASNTAQWAFQMDKKVYATAGFPGDPALLGNQKLILNQNATPLWRADELTQTWFELIHLLDQFSHPQNTDAHLFQQIENKRKEGLSLSQALVQYGEALHIPLEKVIEAYESAQRRAP